MSHVLRALRVWLAQIRYSITRDLIFQNNFLLWVFVEILWMSMQFLFIEVIYSHLDSIAGWTKYQMLLLIGTHYLAMNLFQTLFMTNLTEIPELVRTGRMDFFLLQPLDTQFLLSTRKFDLSSLVNATIAAGLCIYAAYKLSLSPTITQVILWLLSIMAGISLHYSLLLGGVTLSFWITKTEGIIYGYYQIMTIGRIPRDAFRGMWKILFSFFIPVLLISNVPARAIMGYEGYTLYGALFLTATAAFTISSLYFHFGLKNYRSASS